MKNPIKRMPAIREKNEDVYSNRKMMLRWRLMREKEKIRYKSQSQYTKYKNRWFIYLVREATKIDEWTNWDINRLRKTRYLLEEIYNIPMNFFSSFVYKTTYGFMNWEKRRKDFSNYIGFLTNKNIMREFARFIANRNIAWRSRNTRWPDDFENKWGIRTSVKSQKVGIRDKFIEDDIMSDFVRGKINRHL